MKKIFSFFMLLCIYQAVHAQAGIDTIPPVITCPPAITRNTDPGKCFASIQVVRPMATDNSGTPVLTALRSDHQPLMAPFQKGITYIGWKATDAAGNNAFCYQQIQVIDAEAPSIIPPASVTVSTDSGSCSTTNVLLGQAAASDNCGAVTVTHNAPAVFPGGVTIVTWTVTDASGNISTASQTVTVEDHEKPWVLCTGNYTWNNEPGVCGISYFEPLFFAEDNCTPDSLITITAVRNDGLPVNGFYPVGTTVITWTATDASGNSRSCTQAVTILDAEPPTITAINDTFYTNPGQCVASIQPIPPSFTDNCGSVTILQPVRSDGMLNVFADFPVGVTTITWQAKDQKQNYSTVIQTITVIDSTKPGITGLPPIVINANPGKCYATGLPLTLPVTSDNCGVASIHNNIAYSYPVGTSFILWEVKDIHGNSTQAYQQVTVIDNQPPQISAISTHSRCYNSTGNYKMDPVFVSDNCGIKTVAYSVYSGNGTFIRSGTTVNAGGSFVPGLNWIYWTVTDVKGNVSTFQMTISIGNPIQLSIPDAFTLPAGVTANTVYPAYFPAADLTLTAIASGGNGNLGYAWSNGAVTTNITVTPQAPSLYTVTVTDGAGCTRVLSKFVDVENISCGLGLVTVCNPSNGQQSCISAKFVGTVLNVGGNLGACAQPRDANNSKVVEEAIVLELKASPVPSSSHFNISMRSNKETEKMELVIRDVSGKILEVRNVTNGQVIQVGHNYRAGIYIAALRQGTITKSIKLIKLSP